MSRKRNFYKNKIRSDYSPKVLLGKTQVLLEVFLDTERKKATPHLFCSQFPGADRNVMPQLSQLFAP